MNIEYLGLFGIISILDSPFGVTLTVSRSIMIGKSWDPATKP